MSLLSVFSFNHTATTEIYTLSLHDALPISACRTAGIRTILITGDQAQTAAAIARSEEHTSELQSHSDLVCRLLLEKKKPTRSPRPLSGHRTPTDDNARPKGRDLTEAPHAKG